jgi:tRNA-Thr(GGU) m(6)t(6)A37 methyltransferase TsaA
MDKHPDGIRPGEMAVELPAAFDAGLFFVGRIRTPWRHRSQCPKNANEARAAGIVCTVEVNERYAAALTGIDTCTHLLVLYWMHQARRDLVIQTPRHHGGPRGTFALRSPVRPNPVAASVVDLVRVEGCRLIVIGLDCLDGTPLVDLKPHFAAADAAADTSVRRYAEQKVDG